jgi:hypothetical protein
VFAMQSGQPCTSRLIAAPREFIANFEAQYPGPARSEIVRFPETEVTLMIRPSACARITGSVAWTCPHRGSHNSKTVTMQSGECKRCDRAS